MFLIVGLGNPGRRYARTRHNAGFLVVENIARVACVRFRRAGLSRIAQIDHEGRPVVLAMPQTYMNDSGSAVAEFVRLHRVRREEIVVLADDIDLPLGVLRIRLRGGSGGHRGLASIIASLGTEDFIRLKIGVGRPSEKAEVRSYVLGDLDAAEREIFEQAVARAAQAVRVLLSEGPEEAMNRFNGTPNTV